MRSSATTIATAKAAASWRRSKASLCRTTMRIPTPRVRRGGVLLTVRVDDAQHERAIDELERRRPLNTDEQSSGWRQPRVAAG